MFRTMNKRNAKPSLEIRKEGNMQQRDGKGKEHFRNFRENVADEERIKLGEKGKSKRLKEAKNRKATFEKRKRCKKKKKS